MGGIGLACNLNQSSRTYIRTYTYAHTYIYLHTPAHIYICTETTTKQYAAHNMHTIRTQNAHNLHTHKHNNMQHTEQHIQENTETEHKIQNTDTETNNHAQNNAQPQHRCITYDLHTYSFDFYHEYAVINNSNTIELYTISKD